MSQTRRSGQDVRQRVWTAMRIFKIFTAVQIQATADVHRYNLYKYLKALQRSGYLIAHRPKRNGFPGGHAVWRLARDSGPSAPIVRREGNGVYDPNHDTVYPFRDDSHD